MADNNMNQIEQEDNNLTESTTNSLSSPSTEEGARDFISSYTQISYSQNVLAGSDDQTDVESDGEDDLSLDESNKETKLPGVNEISLPQLTSQIVEWSRERFDDYDNEDANSHSDQGRLLSEDMDNLTLEDKERFRFIQPSLLDKIETYSKVLENDLQNIMSHICEASSKSTKTSIEAMKVFDASLNSICVDVDVNIKLMFKIIAKSGELSRSLESIEILSTKIREVKQTLDVFERLMDRALL